MTIHTLYQPQDTCIVDIFKYLHRGLLCYTLVYRACPKGVDPYPEIDGVDEEQLIDCYCTDQCSGSLRLAFRGHSTRPIPFDSSAELVKYRLEVIHFLVLLLSREISVLRILESLLQ